MVSVSRLGFAVLHENFKGTKGIQKTGSGLSGQKIDELVIVPVEHGSELSQPVAVHGSAGVHVLLGRHD
jgi:hypothetical protein